MVIARKKASVREWEKRMLDKQYDIVNHTRIGQFRRLWKDIYHFDMDNNVQPLLFRILCAFLDQGIAIERFPLAQKSFVASIREMENNSLVSFFKTKEIKQKFLTGNYSITELLQILIGKEEYFQQYLFDQQFSHPGWSGFVSAVEDNPQTLLDRKKISLRDLVEFELLMELDALYSRFGKNWKPLADHAKQPPVDLFADVERTELSEVFELVAGRI
jgi:uncharacterized protein YbcC (UPF0753/DUF2309 family)